MGVNQLFISPFDFVIRGNELDGFDTDDDRFFALALKNAQFAMGSTHPNPAVGAVLVKNDMAIAQGYTHPVGGFHAEKHAIAQAGDQARGATLYVTLEPCSHFGRTPPCSQAIIDAGIKRVVYGAVDPNPRVLGEGLRLLRDAYLDVVPIAHPGLLEAARASILPFRSWVKNHRPYVVAKVATSFDNKISSKPGIGSKITSMESDVVVHQLRRATDAIMVGANTVCIDNPSLTARLGEKNHGAQPLRVILDGHGELDSGLKVFDQDASKTIVITSHKQAKGHRNVETLMANMREQQVDIDDALKKLAGIGITSLMIETGRKLFRSVVKDKLADEIWWFRSPTTMGDNGLDLGMVNDDLLNNHYSLVKKLSVGRDELTIFTRLERFRCQ